MELDRQGMLVLDQVACAALLASTRIGRVALTQNALPVILPVAFTMLDTDLVFNVGPGALARAADQADVVCFESDWADEHLDEMWSVWVVGQLSPLRDPESVRRVAEHGLTVWGDRPSGYIRLSPQIFSGRRRLVG